MPWITPPTFHDGAPPHTADDFNALSNNLTFLYEGGNENIAPFQTHVAASNQIVPYYIIHKHRYLHIRLGMRSEPGEELEVYYDATKVFDQEGIAEGTHDYVVDLDPFSLTFGQFYDVLVSFKNASGWMELEWLEERADP